MLYTAKCVFQRATLAERQVDSLKDQLEKLRSSIEQKSTGHDLDSAIDAMKKTNIEVELAAKEKEVKQICMLSSCFPGQILAIRVSRVTSVNEKHRCSLDVHLGLFDAGWLFICL